MPTALFFKHGSEIHSGKKNKEFQVQAFPPQDSFLNLKRPTPLSSDIPPAYLTDQLSYTCMILPGQALSYLLTKAET